MRRLYFLVPDTQVGKKVVDELLVIADVPRGEVEAITERIRKVHPKVDPEGTEPRVPAFP